MLKFGTILILTFLFIGCQEVHLNPPRDPQRVVSLKPNLTEILFALGVEDRVVGVTEHCSWPKEAKEKTKVGEYAAPDIEKIIALQPDLIVTLKEATSPRLASLLKSAGIPVAIFETNNLSEIYQTISKLAGIMHANERSQKLNMEIKQSLDELKTKTYSLNPKKTLIVVQRHPIIAAGHKTFLNELLDAAGASNVIPKTGMSYPHLSMEQVLAWQPEVILDLDPTSDKKGWQEYASLPAVQKDQIYFLSPSLFVPGPRLTQTATMIAHALYPDLTTD